ncbi:hypothetical protein [Sphingomonas oligophenolica]|uniref:MerR family transcriptional regulator n=1 Tax=Sphingomonas oligophenolica TaxID=301154 RepID=A0A502CHQ4_9SPHN|nr:hypothetical protein [Sphingomonas oligophenolica]TPG13185.1 hypothetical protein EAH84_07230 [Sphingomonas oligophenolica]
MPVALSQRDVLSIVGGVHHVVDDRQKALKSRLQHFQRLGFPAGINTGKGKPAAYGARQVVDLLVAFELLQVGLWPEVIVGVLRQLGSELPEAVGRVRFGEVRERALDVGMVLEARALSDLTRHYGDDLAIPHTAKIVAMDQVIDRFAESSDEHRRIVLINVSAMLNAAITVATTAVPKKADQLKEAIFYWAHNFEPTDYGD